MAATSGAVLTGAIINIVTALIAFIVFAFLRKSQYKSSYKFYDPKRWTPAVALKPKPLPSTFFGWIKPVFEYSEPEIIRECGLDTAIYLRLIRYGILLFTWVAVWCVVVIIPINASDDETIKLMEESDSYKFSTFDRLSLANVQPGSMRMWAHVVTVWLVSLKAMHLLWTFSKDSVLLRIQFLGNSTPSGPTHSVLVTDIPAIAAATAEGVKARQALEVERKKSEALAKKQGSGKFEQAVSGVSTIALLGKDQEKPIKETDVRVDMPSSSGTDAMSGTEASTKEAPTVAIPVNNTSAGLRMRRKFEYDLSTTSLDPVIMAEKKLALGSNPKDLVQDEFSLVYGDELDAVTMVHDQSSLDDLVAEYEKRKRDLEDYLDAVRDKSSRDEPLPPATVTLLFPDDWCKEKYGKGMMKKVDAVPFWKDRLLYLESRIVEEQEKARQLVWPSAFVSFKTRLAQSISATGLQQHDEQTWCTRGAPEPRELVWSNLGMTSSTRSSKTSVWWVVFWLMTLFFMIPVAAIQGLIDVPKLASMPGLGPFVSNVVVQKLLEAIVPGLVLKIFLALVPMILAAMMKASGAVSLSEIDFGVVSRFFIFQVIVVFFGNTLAGSFFSQASAWISDPGSVVSVLGTAIPQACTFFVTYIWVNIGTMPIGFIRIVGLVLMWVFMWLAGSPRARDRVFQEQYTNYGTSVTGHTMVILLGIIFCCINPIITPSALVYFLIAAIVEKYNNIYVYRRNYESSGQLWVKILNQVMTALYIFQLVMIGLLAIKKFPYTVLIIPVVLPTVIFHMCVLKLFARPWALMSLHDAAELDRNDKVVDPETLLPENLNFSDEYISPVFKICKGDLTSVLAEAEEADAKVKADVERRAVEKAELEAAKGEKKKGCF